jgi:cytochrome c553
MVFELMNGCAVRVLEVRSGDPDNMMGSIAKKLTDEEIRGLADYFSKL